MNTKGYDILVRPLLTEKITAMREESNKFSFRVKPGANRIQIKRAIESELKVRVERVNVMNVRGKTKRFGRFIGTRASWKKAIVTLKAGEKLELYEGA